MANTAASSTDPAVAARAQDAGIYFIGSYGDESKFAPKVTVTSVILGFKLGYETVAKELDSGTFKPGINIYGIKEGFVYLSPFRLGLTKKEAQAKKITAAYRAGKFAKQIAKCRAIKR